MRHRGGQQRAAGLFYRQGLAWIHGVIRELQPGKKAREKQQRENHQVTDHAGLLGSSIGMAAGGVVWDRAGVGGVGGAVGRGAAVGEAAGPASTVAGVGLVEVVVAGLVGAVVDVLRGRGGTAIRIAVAELRLLLGRPILGRRHQNAATGEADQGEGGNSGMKDAHRVEITSWKGGAKLGPVSSGVKLRL